MCDSSVSTSFVLNITPYSKMKLRVESKRKCLTDTVCVDSGVKPGLLLFLLLRDSLTYSKL